MKIYDPEEMTNRIITRNQNHYGQAEGSPPTDPNFVQHVGRNAQRSFEGLKECLDSDSNEFLPETIAILEYIQNNRLPPIDSLLTTEDVKRGIQVWKERTSASRDVPRSIGSGLGRRRRR